MQPEVAVTAVVAAAVFSPRARRVIRRGLVYGMAGALLAGDAITSFARSVGQGVQEAGASAASAAQRHEPGESGGYRNCDWGPAENDNPKALTKVEETHTLGA
jgi:hypothetical protein